jgi:tRNA-specific 2-thiouridylase
MAKEIGKSRIAVAMSGGVDSSVAAALLVQQGHEVVGLTMRLFDHESAGIEKESIRGCCSLDAIYRAQAVCQKLNIPHYSISMIGEFKHYVIDDFVSEYTLGRTPNPCIRCNTYLKWGALLDKAKKLGCHRMATGHYARLIQVDGASQLHRALDSNKDQSYALWGIPKERLSDILFPLGDLTKPQVRRLAASLELKTAQTPESQEICFIPAGDYSDFLRSQAPELADLEVGELVEETASGVKIAGRHAGYPFYTIGQRKGLGGGFDSPRFVLRTEPQSNRVYVGTREKLLGTRFRVDQLNWLTANPTSPFNAQTQIRYRSAAISGKIYPHDGACNVELAEPAEAITPGQSAAFYDGERLIGGGRIIGNNPRECA